VTAVFTCPRGHTSAESDFCDTCGARITGAAPAAPPVSVPSAEAVTVPDLSPGPSSEPPCPHCGAPRGGSARFCEDCGYDHSTGRLPQVEAAPRAEWTATVFADPDYFAANDVDGVTFPDDAPRQTVTLPAPQVRIGRRSSSKGTAPDLDLTEDPGVSHNHALLTLTIDGEWLVSDLGSTNGTYLNEELLEGPQPLHPGDRIRIGDSTFIYEA
jgi:hypothetical protein